MNLSLALTAVAVIGATVLGLEGVNLATGGEFYLASIQHLAQANLPLESVASTPPPIETATTPLPADTSNQPSQQPKMEQTQPAKPIEKGEEIQPREEFVDPREVKEVQKQIREMKQQIKVITSQLKKAGGSPADATKLNEVSAELNRVQSTLTSGLSDSDLRAEIQEFHNNQYWEEINKIRTRLEVPRELKQINLSLRRLEKIIQTKSIKNIGLNLDRVQISLSEMKQAAMAAQAKYDSGDFEGTQEEMQYFHEGGHPGEIEGTIFRIRDIKNMIKKVKDTTVRAEVDRVLQEVVDTFNAGEYRDARETLDEYADDLQRLIETFIRSKVKRGDSNSINKIRNLEDLIKTKLQQENNNGQPQK